ncbi:MAG: formyltetrahydrofolate deformylase [Cellvibrionaceae bacterium]
MSHFYRLTISCPDRTGVVAAVSSYITSVSGWITEADQYSDEDSGWFYMRNEIKAESLSVSLGEFKAGIEKIAAEFKMEWNISDTAERKRVVLLASKEQHCLSDLLHRWRTGDMAFDVVCVISNHNDARELVEWNNIPYHHVPVDPDNKTPHFERVKALVSEANADAIVLARYMQIFPSELCQQFMGKVINIHHSFLPAFIGAKPYHQAYKRGVKLIGATCHYVTEDLDAGPIISQDIARVQHRHSVEDLVRMGRDVESQTLSRGLRAHLEDRVLIHGNKTIVFE